MIIHFSIHTKFVIGIGTLALIAAGVWSFTKLPIDAVPETANNQVQIILSPTRATMGGLFNLNKSINA